MISITGYWSLFVAADSSFFGSVKQIWQRPYHNLFMIYQRKMYLNLKLQYTRYITK